MWISPVVTKKFPSRNAAIIGNLLRDRVNLRLELVNRLLVGAGLRGELANSRLNLVVLVLECLDLVIKTIGAASVAMNNRWVAGPAADLTDEYGGHGEMDDDQR